MQITRTFDIVELIYNNHNRPDTLAVKRNGKWDKFSSKQYKTYTNEFSIGLLELGVKKGDKIVSISNNRPEWNIMDMGLSQIGAIHVPVYPNIGKKGLRHILRHSDAKILIISSESIYFKIKALLQEINTIEKIYSFDNIQHINNYVDIINIGRKNKSRQDELNKIKASIKPDDVCSIIYTSGTTGIPKGVMLTHNNFISNMLSAVQRLKANANTKMLSILPLCHVLERTVNYTFQYNGHPIYYAESVDTIVADIRDVRPAGFTVVPRVIEKLYDKIILNGRNQKLIKKIIFFWAVNLAHKYKLNNENGLWYALKLKLANKLVFSKWREALGGNIQIIVSGGASLQVRLLRVFHAAGLVIQEGYGLTETSPGIAFNGHDYPDLSFGTVGPVLNGIKVKIADDGEIIVKGPNVMKGYYKDPESTKKAIDEDGWFHTGDIGVLHDNKILQITDRKKSIFKLSTGKYIAPQVIENKIKESPFIEQVMIVGENRKYAAALICPTFEYLHGWCVHHNIKYRDNKKMIQNPKVIERIQKEIDKLNEQLGRHEQPKKFVLIEKEWTVESGELSSTLKLRRSFIKKQYKSNIDFCYT